MTSSSSSSADTAYNNNNNKLNNRVIRKKKKKSLTEYPLSPNLKSLIPSTPLRQPQVEMRGAAEVELDPHECLERDSSSSSSSSSSWDEEMNLASTATSSSTISQQKKAFNQEEDDDDGGCCINVDFEEEEEAAFKPSINIRKIDDDSIHISTIVMKEVSLTSTLFSVLEEEKLDIVFEDQYRTETKAAHNIQVRVQPGYNLDALETKLRSWARCTSCR